jgi:hypothetical protein
MRVLVIGGTRFIGPRLVHRLAAGRQEPGSRGFPARDRLQVEHLVGRQAVQRREGVRGEQVVDGGGGGPRRRVARQGAGRQYVGGAVGFPVIAPFPGEGLEAQRRDQLCR